MSETIVCMIRGGASGHRVQEQGILMAKQAGMHLVFLHVVDIDWLGLANPALQEAARTEMTWLAWVTLGLAYRRARNAGLEVERVVRYGKLFDSTVAYLKEHPAQQILMGSPHPQVEDYDQRLESVVEFARLLEEQTGALVKIVS
jgi:hypothetical protein